MPRARLSAAVLGVFTALAPAAPAGVTQGGEVRMKFRRADAPLTAPTHMRSAILHSGARLTPGGRLTATAGLDRARTDGPTQVTAEIRATRRDTSRVIAARTVRVRVSGRAAEARIAARGACWAIVVWRDARTGAQLGVTGHGFSGPRC